MQNHSKKDSQKPVKPIDAAYNLSQAMQTFKSTPKLEELTPEDQEVLKRKFNINYPMSESKIEGRQIYTTPEIVNGIFTYYVDVMEYETVEYEDKIYLYKKSVGNVSVGDGYKISPYFSDLPLAYDKKSGILQTYLNSNFIRHTLFKNEDLSSKMEEYANQSGIEKKDGTDNPKWVEFYLLELVRRAKSRNKQGVDLPPAQNLPTQSDISTTNYVTIEARKLLENLRGSRSFNLTNRYRELLKIIYRPGVILTDKELEEAQDMISTLQKNQ